MVQILSQQANTRKTLRPAFNPQIDTYNSSLAYVSYISEVVNPASEIQPQQ